MAFTKAQEKEIKRLQGLGFSEKEAAEMVAYDDIVEHSKTAEFDLTEEQQKVAKKYTDIGSKKKNPNYTFTKRERKPNETKRTIEFPIDYKKINGLSINIICEYSTG